MSSLSVGGPLPLGPDPAAAAGASAPIGGGQPPASSGMPAALAGSNSPLPSKPSMGASALGIGKSILGFINRHKVGLASLGVAAFGAGLGVFLLATMTASFPLIVLATVCLIAGLYATAMSPLMEPAVDRLALGLLGALKGGADGIMDTRAGERLKEAVLSFLEMVSRNLGRAQGAMPDTFRRNP